MGIMDLLAGLLGGGGASSGGKRPRQESGRYGKKGQFRKVRNGDKVGRGSNGRYTK